MSSGDQSTARRPLRRRARVMAAVRRRPAVVAAVTAAVVAVAAVAVVLWPTGEESTTYEVGAEGGTFGAAGVEVVVPRGATEDGTELTITRTTTVADLDDSAGWAEDEHPVVDITVSDDLPGAQVRFTGVDVDQADGFVAVFDEDLQTWLPLPTTVDEAAGTVVAEAPHFSRYTWAQVRDAWFDSEVLEALKNAPLLTVPGASGPVFSYNEVAGFLKASWAKVASGYREFLDGLGPQRAACETPADGWTVTSADPGFTGCATESADGVSVHVDSGVNVPYELLLPDLPVGGIDTGLTQNSYLSEWDGIGFVHQVLFPANATLPANRATQFTFTPEASQYLEITGASVAARATPDGVSLAMDALTTMTAWIPQVTFSWQVVRTLSRETLTSIMTREATVTVRSQLLIQEVRRGSTDLDNPLAGATKGFETLVGIWDCATSLVQTQDEARRTGWSTETADALYGSAKNCLLQLVKDIWADAGSAIELLVKTLPDTYDLLKQLVVDIPTQEAENPFFLQFDVVAQHPAPDWRTIAYADTGCLSRAEWEDAFGSDAGWADPDLRVAAVDVVDDGDLEAVVTTSCPTQTSSNPAIVGVYRMADDGPALLGLLGQELDFVVRVDATTDTLTTPSTDVDGDGIVVSGLTQGAGDGPDPQHWGQVAYTWNGTGFELEDQEEAYTSQPILHEALPDGEYGGHVMAGQPFEVFLNVKTLISGDDAVDYCLEQGVPREEAPFCVESTFAVPVAGDLVRALRVAPGAEISYQLDSYGDTVPVAPANLGTMPATAYDDPPGTTYPWTFTVRNGEVVRLEQFFTV